ncbi:MAG: hypothetical protein PHO08_12580 [Methylococcales bacterium]|nr:hypothetical protein [Methylococcales bacterium]MDD5632647.1 hypothetical protein [Methylococcales bacterium]
MNKPEWRSNFVYFQDVKIDKISVRAACLSQEAAQVDVCGSDPEIIGVNVRVSFKGDKG